MIIAPNSPNSIQIIFYRAFHLPFARLAKLQDIKIPIGLLITDATVHTVHLPQLAPTQPSAPNPPLNFVFSQR